MAEQKDRALTPAEVAVAQMPSQVASQAFAEAAAEAEKQQLDEAGPGHHYLTADGRKVDADGKPFKG